MRIQDLLKGGISGERRC